MADARRSAGGPVSDFVPLAATRPAAKRETSMARENFILAIENDRDLEIRMAEREREAVATKIYPRKKNSLVLTTD